MSSQETSAEVAVREASDRFYDALEQMANGDPEPMSSVWAHDDNVTTMHPIGGREIGWEEVRGPWSAVAEMSSDGEVTRADQFIRVFEDTAYEIATEKVSMTFAGEPVSLEVRATNVYRLVDDEWKIIHHHTDVDDEFVALLEQSAGN
ncbi:YybH family protein [Haloarcula marina]|uniref:YybH family protein n=1 Tax=Haloarcula marina TaxID=2961574 RepID=UPI0020B667F8|nr:nuclear transport factor 2 family protein [Halomicroarcula marina]